MPLVASVAEIFTLTVPLTVVPGPGLVIDTVGGVVSEATAGPRTTNSSTTSSLTFQPPSFAYS